MITAILDIDGVLADSWHRRHHIRKVPPDWPAFFDDCENDPALPLVKLPGLLAESGFQIVLVTSRPATNFWKTQAWLDRVGVHYDRLVMCPEDTGATGGGAAWKVENIRRLCAEYDVEFIFEDDPQVVIALRGLGLPVVPILSGYYGWTVRP